NVQFLVSAHSPAIVAGCAWGEVAVLRRVEGGRNFRLKPMERNYMGVPAEELYQELFEIRDIDRMYLQYSMKATTPEKGQLAAERERLAAKSTRWEAEEQRLAEVVRETELINLADDARKKKLAQSRQDAHVRQLEQEVARLKAQLALREQPP